MDMKRFFLYFIVIAALALAGCGGNGGGTPTTMEPDMCPSGQTGTPPNCVTPPPPMAAVDLSGLLMGFGLTADDAGTHEIAAGASMDVGNVTFSCPAGGMSCSVEVAADGTATSTGGQATASPSAAAQMAYDAQKEEERKAALAKGMGIAMALQASTGPVPTAPATGTVPVKVTRATTGDAKIELFVADTAGTATVDFADDDDITRSAPPAITGWMGETQSRTDEDEETTDMVTVYTDIKNAKPQKLKYGAGVTDGAGTDVPIPTPGAGTQIVLDDDETDYNTGRTDGEDDESVTGTVNGIPGTFTCTTAACTVAFVDGDQAGRADTTVATFTGEWLFESDENIESQATQDQDYLYFGYWLQDQGDNDFAFNTFFGGNTPFTIAGSDLIGAQTFTAAESRAVYNGSAAGKYVEKTLAIVGGKAEAVAIAGDYFTADARLTAYFGTTDNVAVTMQNTIRGTISNFKNSNGDDVGFTINLNAIDFGAAASGTEPGSGTTAGTFINGTVAGVHRMNDGIAQSTSGEWEGQFFGPAGTGTNAAQTMPTGVAGDFQAHFDDGHVVGAFGATR